MYLCWRATERKFEGRDVRTLYCMKQIIKHLIKSFLKRSGFVVVPIPEYQKNLTNKKEVIQLYSHFLALYLANVGRNDFFFVQIGAHDGKTGDPMYSHVQKYGLRGVLIEPQPKVFSELERNYQANKNVRLANIAIAKTSGTTTLYTADVPGGSLNASFVRDVTIKTIRAKIPFGTPEDFIMETSVKTSTFADFFREYEVQRIDLLQVDCEGYDAEIIKMFDFNRFTPTIVNYESKHLKSSEKSECEQLLKDRGYTVFTHGSDTCAYRA